MRQCRNVNRSNGLSGKFLRIYNVGGFASIGQIIENAENGVVFCSLVIQNFQWIKIYKILI